MNYVPCSHKDRTFPVRQSRPFYEDLGSAGKSCELFIAPGAAHVFNFLNARQGEEAWEKTIQFLEEHLNGALPHR